jgi:hypothetical protein
MPLTDTAFRHARPRERVYRLNDGRGLCLLIRPNGAKWWRFRYRWLGTEQMLSMGTYPDAPLLDARNARDEARRLLAKGVDPAADLINGEWRITHRHMKRKIQHIVPLSQQAIDIFYELKVLTENREYVFPAVGNSDRPMSENTMT